MAEPIVIDVAKAFSRFPFGRSDDHGPHNGQTFREQVAIPALAQGRDVVFDLTGVVGAAPSFLEEAFGGLVRAARNEQDAKTLIARIKIVSKNDPFVGELVRLYMTSALGEVSP